MPAEELRDIVTTWCEVLTTALQPHGVDSIAWDEGDHVPYFTDRPGWEGYSALLVWAAHAEHPDLPMPVEVPESWVDDPAFVRSTTGEFRSRYGTILRAELWLPAEFPFVFEGPTLVSEKGAVGSVFTLKQQLDDLHQQTAASLEELKRTAKNGEGPANKQGFPGGLFSRKEKTPEPEQPGFAEVAELGLSMFRDLAAKACEHRLPILLHF